MSITSAVDIIVHRGNQMQDMQAEMSETLAEIKELLVHTKFYH